MGSPYQLILLNLIHIQGVLYGATGVLISLRRYAVWRPAMIEWRAEQERQLKVLLVLFKQLGGNFGPLHKGMLWLAESVGWSVGLGLAFMPAPIVRVVSRQTNTVLTVGLERAGHQIALADWAEWLPGATVNPPKALLELASSRREWPSRWEALAQFL